MKLSNRNRRQRSGLALLPPHKRRDVIAYMMLMAVYERSVVREIG